MPSTGAESRGTDSSLPLHSAPPSRPSFFMKARVAVMSIAVLEGEHASESLESVADFPGIISCRLRAESRPPNFARESNPDGDGGRDEHRSAAAEEKPRDGRRRATTSSG